MTVEDNLPFFRMLGCKSRIL